MTDTKESDYEALQRLIKEMKDTDHYKRAEKALPFVQDLIKGVPIGTILEHVGDLAGMGWMVKILVDAAGYGIEPEDPVMKMLKELNSKMDELSTKISDGFADMKAFNTALNFYTKANDAKLLKKFMNAISENPIKRNYDDFKTEYDSQSPKRHIFALIGLLEVESTNPLKMAMEGDPYMQKTTFDGWRTIITDLLGQLIFVESYASGLYGTEGDGMVKQLTEVIQKVDKDMDEWAVEYKKRFKKEVVKRVANEARDKNTSHSERAKFIKDHLDKGFTDAAYYILVFDNDPTIWSNEGFIPKYKSQPGYYDQAYQLLNTGNCCVVVYYSMTANQADNKKLERLKTNMAIMRKGWNRPAANFLLNNGGPASFVCKIPSQLNPVVESANCNLKWGPGWWYNDIEMLYYLNDHREKVRAHNFWIPCYLVVGFT